MPTLRSELRGEPWVLGDRLFETTAEKFTVWRCGACGVRFLSPVPSFEQLARYYPKTYWSGPSDRQAGKGTHGRLTELYRKTMLVDHARFVRRIAREQRQKGLPVRILDIGCGDGSVLESFAIEDAFGLDTSHDALQQVKARGLGAVRGLITESPIQDASCSIVTMFHVLEHVPDPVAFLRAAGRAIAPGGSLVVQVPNARCVQAAVLGRRWAGYDVPRHLINFTPRHLRDVVARAGFRVVRETQLCVRDNPTTLVNSVFPRLYPPRRGGSPSWLNDLCYLGLTVAAIVPTLVGGLLGLGATVMVEAQRDGGSSR